MSNNAAQTCAQPFSSLIKTMIIRCINGADDPMEREDRIQTSLDLGIITYAESYALRCGDDM